VLFVGLAINLAAFVLSTQAGDIGSTHELAALVPFGAVLAGRLLPGRPAVTALVPALAAVLAVYCGALAYSATRPAGPAKTQAVASWLTENHLTAGIGTYWTANITTAATGGRVEVRPVVLSCGRFAPYAWESRKAWYEPPAAATFLVLALTKSTGANGTAADATAQFGPAQRTARIGPYEVLVWNHDLMPAVAGGYAPGCGPTWHR
jgi:hypothetical protein